MSPRWLRRAAGAALTVALVAALWWFLAPPQVGGRTAWAVVHGTSMEPRLHDGDLVLVRARSSYDTGDVVLFSSETLGGAHVLHRVTQHEGGHYVTRGDNRTQDDPDKFTQDAIVGKLWLTFPGAGSTLAWAAQPLPLAVIVFVLAFVLLAGGREVSRRRDGPSTPPVHATPTQAGALRSVQLHRVAGSVIAAGLVASCLFGALALLAWSRPSTRQVTVDEAYAHTGIFSYDATARRSAVYPTGQVETGQAVFRSLAPRVRFAFDYAFTSIERSSILGGIGLHAVLSDGDGWSRPLVLAPTKPFSGSTAHVEGLLDIRRLEASVERMRTLTKTSPSTFQVSVTPTVEVAGYSGSTLIDTSFEPALQFVYDGLALRPVQAGEDETPLTPKVEGSSTRIENTTVGAGAITLSTSDARRFAGFGLVVSLIVVAVSALATAIARRPSAGTAAVLHARHGDRIVPAEVVIPDGRWVTDVRDADSLGLIAEHYDRVILRTVENGQDVYVVDDGVAVYRFCATELAEHVIRMSPLPDA
jgi:signal peptidase I